jgi:hypothetical protein
MALKTKTYARYDGVLSVIVKKDPCNCLQIVHRLKRSLDFCYWHFLKGPCDFAYESAYDSVYDFLHKVVGDLFFNHYFQKCAYTRLQLVSDGLSKLPSLQDSPIFLSSF